MSKALKKFELSFCKFNEYLIYILSKVFFYSMGLEYFFNY